jgi:hypothetical protein
MPTTEIFESLSYNNKTEEFYLQVARGQVRGHEIRHIFGYNPDVDSASEETVWTAGGLYSHTASPVIMTVSSTSTNDNSTGTGARQIYLLGINSTGGEVSETVNLNGQTGVNTIHTYTEIQSCQVISAGSSGHNLGNINIGTGTITGGVPANIYGHILANENNSLIGHYTVPTGYTGYLISGSISSGTEGGSNYVIGRLKIKENGLIYTSAITTFNNGKVDYDFKYPIKINAGACFSATAETTANNEKVSCYFQLLLVRNNI